MFASTPHRCRPKRPATLALPAVTIHTGANQPTWPHCAQLTRVTTLRSPNAPGHSAAPPYAPHHHAASLRMPLLQSGGARSTSGAEEPGSVAALEEKVLSLAQLLRSCQACQDEADAASRGAAIQLSARVKQLEELVQRQLVDRCGF
eukprot:83259-Chlamydomonas_euryale.AAC.4